MSSPGAGGKRAAFRSGRNTQSRGASLILLISPYPEDHEFFCEISLQEGWRVECIPGWQRAKPRLNQEAFPVIVSEAVLPDGTWKDVLGYLQCRVSRRPLLVVISRLADDRLWADVLNRGGFDPDGMRRRRCIGSPVEF